MKRYLALCLVTALTAQATVTSYSPPVGGVQVTCSQGLRFTGMPLVNPTVHRDLIASNSGTVATLNNSSANAGAALNSTKTYYVELTAGPEVTYVGDRFEVNVAATIASANNTVTIVTGASTNTISSLPVSLAGYTLTIRPHVTIGQLFGTKTNELMNGATVSSNADQVLFLNPVTQGYDTYYYLRNGSGTVAQWTLVGGGSTNRDTTVIPPGVGVVVVRKSATPVTLTWVGNIRLNSFVQPLVAGLNLVAEPLPISSSPVQRAMSYANGMAGSTLSSLADQILINNGGSFSSYYLLRNGSGTIEQWTLIGGGSTNRGNESLFSSTGSVIIKKISPDSNYSIPYTLSL